MIQKLRKTFSIIDAFEEQKRIISALMFRELKTRFGNTKLGAAWLLLEPISHILVIMVLWKMIGRMGEHYISSEMFLLTGILPFLYFRTSIIRIMKSVEANKALLVFEQIKITDLIVTRWFIEIFIYIAVAATMLAIFYFTGIAEIRIESPYRLFIASSLLWFSALSAGIFFMMLNAIFPLTEKILVIVLRLLYFISLIIFSYNRIPHKYQEYISYNPIAHIISMIRESFFIEIAYDANIMSYKYVFLFFGSMLCAGTLMMLRYKKYLLQEHD